MKSARLRRILISAAALVALAATAAGAVRVTAQNAYVVCLPSAVIQAWS
jgi:hypothetical protein